MILRAIQKLMNQEPLTPVERASVMNWFAQMEQAPSQLADLFHGDSHVESLDQITPNLGIQMAGAFLATNTGIPNPTAAGFTGSFMSAAPFSFGGRNFHIGGVNAGVLQWGASADDGTLIAEGGGIALGASGLSIKDSVFGNSGIQIQYNGGAPRLYIGDGASQFLRYEGGSLTISGNITATTGTFSGDVQSANYLAGVRGFILHGASGDAEFNNIFARGMIHTVVFRKDVTSSIGGTLMVLPADVLDADMTALDDSTLTTKGTSAFAVGDILHLKNESDEEWMQVTDITNAPTYSVLRDRANGYHAIGAVPRVLSDADTRVTSDGDTRVVTGDSNPAWKKGQAVVSYGQSGDGGIQLVSGASPEIDLFTHSGSPWTDLIKHVQMKEDSVKFGANIALAALTGFLFFAVAASYNGESMGAGDVMLGDNSAGKANMLWDASAGLLKFRTGTTTTNYLGADGSLSDVGAKVKLDADVTSLSIFTDHQVPLSFGITVYDDAGFVDLVAHPTRITIPAGMGGRYTVGFNAYMNTTYDPTEIGIFINGETMFPAVSLMGAALAPAQTKGFLRGAASDDLLLQAGDYLELGLRDHNANRTDIEVESYVGHGPRADSTCMWVRRIR